MTGRAARFARNLSWSVVGQVVLMGLSLALIPVIIKSLGLEGYGYYLLLQATCSYLLIATMGTGAASLRFIPEAMGKKHGRAMLDAARYTFSVHLLGVLAAAAATAALAPFIAARVVRLTPDQMQGGVLALRCAAAGAVLAAAAQAGGQVLQGLQRFEGQSAISVVQGMLALGLAAFLAKEGLGFGAVARGWIFAQLAAGAAAAWLAWRALAPARQKPDGPPIAFGRFMSWGLAQQLGPLAAIIIYQLDKILVARGASLTGLTLYAVPANLLQRLQMFPAIVSSVLSPMIIEMHGESGREEDLRRIYLRSVRFTLWTTLPALVLMFAMMPQFLSLWLGGRFGDVSVWPARLLVLAQAFWLLGTIPGAVTFATDKPLYIPAYAWAQAIVSVVAWRFLIPRYQLMGAAGGALLAQALPVAGFLVVTHARSLKLSWSRYAAQALAAPALSAALSLALLMALHQRASSWPMLFLISLAGVAVFAGSMWPLMHDEDKEVIWRLVRSKLGRPA